jgi:hypothetical protein
MPTLTRWFIKTGLVYFVLAIVVALLMQAQPVLELAASWAMLQPVYFHMFMVGWVLQVIIGVSYWFFPRLADRSLGNENLGWLVFIWLNTGLLLRVIGETVLSFHPAALWGWVLVLSALLQWLGGLAYVLLIWKRVKPK